MYLRVFSRRCRVQSHFTEELEDSLRGDDEAGEGSTLEQLGQEAGLQILSTRLSGEEAVEHVDGYGG